MLARMPVTTTSSSWLLGASSAALTCAGSAAIRPAAASSSAARAALVELDKECCRTAAGGRTLAWFDLITDLLPGQKLFMALIDTDSCVISSGLPNQFHL